MSRVYDKIVIVAFLAVACAPLVARLARIDDHVIHGSLPPTVQPGVTLAGIRDETFQPAFTSSFESSLGLKGYAIFTDNTVLYHALRDTKPGATVYVGNDDVLFLNDDIAYYNAPPETIFTEPFDRFATKLAALQTTLAARRRALVPVLVPSKTSIYRDAVPARWTRGLGSPRPSDELVYRGLRRALDAHHVHYVDARALLETSTEPRDVLWAKTGRHWTEYGACLAWARVAQDYTAMTGRSLETHCELRRVRGRLEDGDYDLARLLNAGWIPHPHESMTIAPGSPAIGPRPKVMLVGSSFCWALIGAAEHSQQVDASLAYYNSTLYTGPNHIPSDLRSTPTAWRDAMLDNDLYVLDLFEPYMGSSDSHIEYFPDELAKILDADR